MLSNPPEGVTIESWAGQHTRWLNLPRRAGCGVAPV